jgi:hypothetical protein
MIRGVRGKKGGVMGKIKWFQSKCYYCGHKLDKHGDNGVCQDEGCNCCVFVPEELGI